MKKGKRIQITYPMRRVTDSGTQKETGIWMRSRVIDGSGSIQNAWVPIWAYTLDTMSDKGLLNL